MPFSVFDNRNRVMTFVSLFLAGGVMLTLTVMIGLLVQDVLGYSRAAGRHLLHPVRDRLCASAACWPPGWRRTSRRAG